MLKIWVEKPVETFMKWAKSSFLLLFLICLLSLSYFAIFSYTSISTTSDQWNCPSCPQFPLTNTNSFTIKKATLSSSSLSPSPSSSPSSPTSLSHIVFSISTSASTWQTRMAYSQLWWDPSSMRGHVWFEEDPHLPPCTTCPPIKISPADSSKFGDRASASRIAKIVTDSYNLGMEDVRWFVMGDDDTVFFAENLAKVLGKYDHKEMWYVGGGGSESVEQDMMHSYGMAFGGGGFAVSAAAARELARGGLMEGCLERYRGMWGSDQRVWACLSEMGVPLTREPGFHQVDLRGDIFGMLAAHPLAPLISLHHLDDVEPISPLAPTQLDALKTLIHASKFDPARTLQHTLCYVVDQAFNWSVSVSWAYTVQIYPFVLPTVDLETPLQTFKTWRTFKDGPFVFNTRRPVPSDKKCEKPARFFLHRVQGFGNGMSKTTVTEYLKYDEGEEHRNCSGPSFVAMTRVKLVRAIAPLMDPNVWQKAPRRHCCETRRIKKGKVMEVRIRDCYAGEVTSPP